MWSICEAINHTFVVTVDGDFGIQMTDDWVVSNVLWYKL